MYRFLVLLTLALPPILAHNPFTGLRFADSTNSYIMLKPDMQPVREKISLCAWVHKKKSGGNPTVLRYNAPSAKQEIQISDSSSRIYMLKQATKTRIKAPTNQWHHHCLTWSFTSRTSKFYYNGKLITSTATSARRKLAMGGSIAIGQQHRTTKLKAKFYGQAYSFGGELFKLNIFSKQLTDEEISEMYGSGMCSEFEESLTEETFLKWDTLLNDTALHNVEKFNMTQCPSHTHKEPTEAAEPTTEAAEPTTEAAEPTTEAAESTTETRKEETPDYRNWNILYTADFYNQEVRSELSDQLGSLWEILGEFKGHTIDNTLIKHLLKHH